MKHTTWRTVLAGTLGGLVFSALTAATFGILGAGGGHGTGLLFDPQTQSAKVMAVWTTLQPLPLMKRAPFVVFSGFTLLIVGYSFLFATIRDSWPEGYWSRLWRLGLVIWFFSCMFFEFFGPLNLLAEPLHLLVIELVFWEICALGASAVIVAILA
jgi:hypothetical protein